MCNYRYMKDSQDGRVKNKVYISVSNRATSTWEWFLILFHCTFLGIKC